MAHPISESHPLHRLFRGLTEQTFHVELGIADPRLVGYVAGLLVRFVPSESLGPPRDGRRRALGEVAALVAEAETAEDGARRLDCHRHVGDVTLFWTGVYPEALAPRRAAEPLIDYQRQGKRAYLLASTYDEGDGAEVLRRLSAEFELCAFGLSRVRREWERLETDTDRPGRSLFVA